MTLRRTDRGVFGGVVGPGPVGAAGLKGIKYHLLVTADELPRVVAITGATRHDSKLVRPILDGLAPIKGRSQGRPRRGSGTLRADKAVGLPEGASLPASARDHRLDRPDRRGSQ
ncbi:hypothetical protein GCM10011374_41100 [Kocuria dechangensis]|uniref:Transposase IS4-like domain-containing protein n=1 Tax=Kocuria dechangensis TaxID=1176249 RepID=A0A917H9N2_9MICC|nr:hypothetical protein GCM10011374_41100 [Kocuria dechangensis]